jgi:transketolase
MTVLVPGDYEEAKQATIEAARYNGPVYLRFGRDTYPVVKTIHTPFTIGKAKLLRIGTNISIISTGIMVHEALLAADILKEQGVSATVLHMPTIKPIDTESILMAAKRTCGIITCEEHSIIGGLGEAVAAIVAEYYPCPVIRVGVMDKFGESGTAQELLDKYGLRSGNIVAAALKIVHKNEIIG